MNLNNKKYLYVNGSSVSAGGGFEEYKFRTDIRDAYKQKGINLPKTQIECSFAYMIATDLNLILTNESKSGSGIDRLVRKSMEFIYKNLDTLKETIFIFELQSGLRLDWYVDDWNKYGVLNASYNPFDVKNNTKYPFTLVKEWHVDNPIEQQTWNDKYQTAIDGYLNNFFNHDIQFEREADKLIMFISFLNQMGVDYLMTIPNELDSKYSKIIKRILPSKNDINLLFGANLWSFSESNQLQIRNEVNHTDNHLGYFGNKKIAKILTNYIINSDEYKIPIYKIYTNDDFSLFNEFFVNTDVILKKTTNPDKSDCIFLFGLDTNFNKSSDVQYIENLSKQLKDIDLQNKRFLLVYFHEKMNNDIFEEKINILEKKLNISKNQVILIDSSINKKINTNKEVPLELKIKQYSEYYSANFFKLNDSILNDFRDKKFTFLMGQSRVERIYTFDKLVHYYDNISEFKNENIIGINQPIVLSTFSDKIKIHLTREDIKLLHLPWVIDNSTDIYKFDKTNAPIHQRYKDSIFSIINETQSEYEPHGFSQDFLIDPTIRFSNFQISEKTLLPILNGNLPFIIHDGLIYQKLEEIGFDFSYLKNIFKINYKTNSFKQNADSIELFINYIKSKNIIELNEIRLNNIEIIKNNLKILNNIFDGYLSKNEREYIKWLFNEKDSI